MDSRKQKILEAVVLDYIETAEPVGSRTISKKYNLGVSSATIRNEMADLEEMGLIEQPHTSAGRVPSDAGYRYYVDYLMTKSAIEEEAKQMISKAIQSRQNQIEDVLQDSMKLLAEATNCTTMMMLKETHVGARLQLLQLLLVEPGKALMVIIMEGDKIEHRFLSIPESMTKEDLDLVSAMMNQNLRGLKVDDWQRSLLENVFHSLSRQRQVVDRALEMLSSILDMREADDKIYLDGSLNMLSQPEFQDVNKAKNLLQSLKQKEVVTQLMEADDDNGIVVKIGAETGLDEVKDCSVIVANYKVKGETVGKVGLIGPTRMDYATAVAMLNAMAQTLEEAYKDKD